MLLLLTFVPQPAFAGDAGAVSTIVSFGAVGLAIAASLWAVAAGRTAGKLRNSISAANARAGAAISAREAIIETGRESVLVWGRDGESVWSYGESDRLLDSCLKGPDALLLSQALDDLSQTGAPFALKAHDTVGEAVQLRGGAVGALAVLRAERQATAKERDTWSLADALPFPVWLRDRSLAINWVNSAYAQAVGAGDTTLVIASQIALERSEQELALTAQTAGKAAEGKCYIRIAGARRALLIREIPVEGGAVLGIALDVTELAAAETKLQQHMEAQTDTLDRLATAVAVFDREQRLAFHNSAFVRLWGLPEEWLKLRPADGEILDRLRELQRLPEQRNYQAWKRERLGAYDARDSYLPDEQWHLPTGKTLRVVAQRHPLGGVTYFYEDITEKLALESSYNTLIGVQRATLDSLGEGVAVFGLDGRLKLHNAALARLWRFEPADLSGEPHVQKLAAVCVERFGESPVWQKLLDSVASGEERQHNWGYFERSDHAVLSVAQAPLPDGAMLVTFADVTDRFRAEAALRERNLALLAADELKSEFVQHASFLFRNPLNAVLGFADLLSSGHAGALSAKQQDYVQSILIAAQKLGEITSDILDLAMIESGDMRLELARADLFDLLSRAAEPFRQQALSRDIVFDFNVPADIGDAVLDERRIRQIVFNLLSNAVRYTPRGGEIALGAAIAGDELQIHVSDSGPGIAPEVQPRVFGRFEAKARSGQRGGAGLGLALVHRFVALHDGWVEIETGEGRGTLVRCHLPRRLSEQRAPEREDIHAA